MQPFDRLWIWSMYSTMMAQASGTEGTALNWLRVITGLMFILAIIVEKRK